MRCLSLLQGEASAGALEARERHDSGLMICQVEEQQSALSTVCHLLVQLRVRLVDE